MPRYWAISPYESAKQSIFEHAWRYDLNNNTIAVGWYRLGDTTDLDQEQLRARYAEKYPTGSTGNLNMFIRFWHAIQLGDIIVARQGTKRILAIGTVNGKPFYDPAQGQERVGQSVPENESYSNFLPVTWQPFERTFDRVVFGRRTLSSLDEHRFLELTEGAPPLNDIPSDGEAEDQSPSSTEFILEKYLEDFIVSNFGAIFAGTLTYGDAEGNSGQQYATDIGRIDILARDSSTNAYVVIELKKGRGSDQVVGQILRYMGWVKEELCTADQGVEGLIICRESDDRLDYALKMLDNVNVKYYKVDFELSD
jgi:restriction system protein